MDSCVSIEVMIALLAILLHMGNGFTIRAHPSSNQQEHHQRTWPTDVDRFRDMADRMQFRDFHPQDTLKPNTPTMQQRPIFTPDDPFFYDTFASLSGRGNANFKRPMTPFATTNDNVHFENELVGPTTGVDDINDNDKNGNNEDDNRAGQIDVIATFSYPQNVPSLDDLPMTSTIGQVNVPIKRQQGWYVQYGKRASPNSLKDSSLEDSNPRHYDDPNTKIQLPQILYRSQPANEVDVKPQHQLQLNLQLRRNLERLENDLKISNIAYDIVKSYIDDKSQGLPEPHSPVKRQQGWFTQYGKRSPERVPHSYS